MLQGSIHQERYDTSGTHDRRRIKEIPGREEKRSRREGGTMQLDDTTRTVGTATKSNDSVTKRDSSTELKFMYTNTDTLTYKRN